MDTLDIILLAIALIVAVDGFRKGFLTQATSILSIVLGVKLSVRWATQTCAWLSKYIDASPQVIKLISFAILFIAVAIALKFACILLEKLLKFITLGWVNRLLGVILAILKYLLILALAAWIFKELNSKFAFIKTDFLDDSVIYPWIREFADKVFPSIKELLTNK